MLISSENIDHINKRDFQRKKVYQFDTVLENEMIKRGNYFKKLYKNLPKDATIIQLAHNIADDFCLSFSSDSFISTIGYSYYLDGNIYFCEHHLKENNVEVLLHEFAHLLCDTYFINFSDHGGEFISVLRFLFDFYDIIKHDEFNDLLKTHYPDIVLIDDFILLFNKVKITEIDTVKNKLKSLNSYFLNQSNCCIAQNNYISGIRKIAFETDDEIHHFITPENNSFNDGFHIVINKANPLRQSSLKK